MDVFLIPLGRDRTELYCESPDEIEELQEDEPQRGWLWRQVARFRAMLAEAEEDRRRRERGEPSEATGLWRKLIGKIAEAVAEQRLLWRLRHESSARLIHPDDLDGARALELARAHFAADYARHRRWAVIDGLLAAVLGPGLFFVPGPNVVAYYFVFRSVGHFFSMRGAAQGLKGVTWQADPSAPLSEVRRALELPDEARRMRLDQIAHALGLEHLASFAERVAPRPS